MTEKKDKATQVFVTTSDIIREKVNISRIRRTMTAGKKNRENQFHDSITVQGLSQVLDGNSNNVRRIIWLLILCGGIAFTAFNIYTQVTLYLSVPVSIRVDQLLAKRLPFPTITICNNNYVSRSGMNGTDLEWMIPMFLPYIDFDEHIIAPVDLTKVDFSKIFSPEESFKSWKKLTHTLNDTIIRCDWESGPCSLDNFTNVLTDINFCVEFNAAGTLLAKSSGRLHGLRVVLNVQQDDYFRSLLGLISTGFMVAVHSSEVPPILSEMGIAVTPGFQHFVGVDVKSQSAKNGISGCGTRTLNFTSANYSREACRLECRGKYVVEKCGCKDMSVPNTAPFCHPEKYQNCFLPAMEEYLQTGTGCEENCPEPCSFISFNTQHSSAPLTEDYVTEYTKAKGQTEEYWRKNLVILEVYLTSMTFQNMEKRVSYEILDLFCDIGGALGLLLGASIFTVLELFDLLFVKSLSGLLTRGNIKKLTPAPH